MRCRSGKHIHMSRGQAEAHLRSILRIDPDYDGDVYPCTKCLGWHVGSFKALLQKRRTDRILQNPEALRSA